MDTAAALSADPSSRQEHIDSSHLRRLHRNDNEGSIRAGLTDSAKGRDQAPANLPRSFQGMLRTSTETDIGQLSTRPSRIPPPLHASRTNSVAQQGELSRLEQAFEPYGGPRLDDRRRLPSYARDNSSEIISMYETASQKAHDRAFENFDRRSSSLTRTSYSTNALYNQRSYTSLRSQAGGNGHVQRPKSPFAYPTRLRRPGFRPSSPALTDGGMVDYSRRTEIGRIPYVSDILSSFSPSPARSIPGEN